MIYTLRRMQMPAGSQRQGQRRRRRDEKEGNSRGEAREDNGRRGKEDDTDILGKEIKREIWSKLEHKKGSDEKKGKTGEGRERKRRSKSWMERQQKWKRGRNVGMAEERMKE